MDKHLPRQDKPPCVQCRATAKGSGVRCLGRAIPGGMVCRKHGGCAPQVKRKAAQRLKDMLEDAIDPDRSMRETGRLAYSDIRALFGPDGKLLPVKDWPEDIARAVKSVDVVRGNVDKGDGKYDNVVKITLWDKPRPLENLMKHHGQLTERLEISGSVDVVQRLQEARKRLNEAKGG
jgi:hypothetical protein